MSQINNETDAPLVNFELPKFEVKFEDEEVAKSYDCTALKAVFDIPPHVARNIKRAILGVNHVRIYTDYLSDISIAEFKKVGLKFSGAIAGGAIEGTIHVRFEIIRKRNRRVN